MKRMKTKKAKSRLRKKAKEENPNESESFYDSIRNFGYGPPDIHNLGKAGWRKYFDDMPESDRYNLTHNVLSDLLPKEWKDRVEIRVEWLDGVDKDVTSRSHAFACCPRYQYIWQNGYGPEDGDELDIEGWRKYEAEMSEDKRQKMNIDLFFIPDDLLHDVKLREVYMKQVQESEGFDVDVRITDGGRTIVPMFYDMSQAKYDDNLIKYSIKALDVYNEREGSDYVVTEVVKACTQAVFGVMYYITFQAKNSEGHIRDFQAKVRQQPKVSEEIILVRPKPIGLSFYNRVRKFGYGPPDGGHNLGEEGWRKYFDDMFDDDRMNLICKVFGDVFPEEWDRILIEVHVDWLNGVDKYLTSRSLAFARYPHYQHIWQNGYGPRNGENLDIEAWKKYMAEMPNDETSIMMDELFTIPTDPAADAKLWETYQKQVKDSKGFDVNVRIRGLCGGIFPMFSDMSQAKYDKSLMDYSKKALDEYNKVACSDYIVTEVLKGCVQGVVGYMYYITFQASNSEGCSQVFQAQVLDSQRAPLEIIQVKIKT